MIPFHKLSKLPRSQKLRKAAKIVGEAERRFAASGKIEAAEAGYLCGMMELLSGDGGFSAAAADELKAAQSRFAAVRPEEAGGASAGGELRRALNAVYWLLMAETGRYPADWDFVEASGALDLSKRRPFPGMYAYLEDIRSPFNVGSMFRTAESFGAEKIWLSPLCADPRHKRAERTAMGCVDALPWERFPRDPFAGRAGSGETAGSSELGGGPEPALSFAEGPFFALETGGEPLERFRFPPRGIMIAGSEELGVSPRALAVADASLGRVSIPVRGAKGSLNVSVAFGIAMRAWAAALWDAPQAEEAGEAVF